ncbi:MAG: YdcF family protein [Clostridia bacterium]|nr:YdcF family protein [Clostridia bacterium]
MYIIGFGAIVLLCWTVFLVSLNRDRSRYRNCYFLFIALLSVIPFLLSVSGSYMNAVAVVILNAVLLALLIVPFFLIYNGVVMMKREGRHLSQLLSLVLGVMILLGEAAFVIAGFGPYFAPEILSEKAYDRSAWFIACILFSGTVIYGSAAFLIFAVYTLFLQIIPRKKDFDYVIIHGAGLLDGQRVSKLLRDRLDKAAEVYRKDPTPPKLIPSGGRGSDEYVSEAEAMKGYLLAQGIPESDIILEGESKTTLENLEKSKKIIDGMEGRKYTALVTSNYHVYRALRYCRKIGLKCTGIGSHVAFYYWPSALIREFIAIHAEKKHAVLFIAGWAAWIAFLLTVFLRWG